MVTISTYTAAAFLTVALFLLAGALYSFIRGAGGITALRQQMIIHDTALEALDVRLTREIKTRAGLSRSADAEETKDVTDEAKAILAAQSPVLPFPARPKRIFRRF